MSQEDDSGLPEEAAGKLDQTNAVPVNNTGPWRNSDHMWTFQNYTDLEEYGEEVALAEDPVVVLVIDNEDADLAEYPKNKHYWVIYPLTYDSGTTTININHLTEYLSIMVEDGVATIDEVNGYEPPGGGYIKLGTFQGYPVLARDPAIDDRRPESQTDSTTGATTGTTVTTTTTAKVGAAGVVTESETTPAEVGLDAFGGAGPTVSAADPLDAFGGAGPTVSGPASAALATGAQTGTDPCLPQNAGFGSGSTPPASEPYPDAILRQSRAAAAAPASVIADPLDAFGGAGPAVTSAVTGGRGNGAAEAARRRADATAPTTVTQPTSSPTSSSTPSARPPNVYIYEPITPGFDRYDFNTGKKVYTPNNGPSRNNSGQTSTTSSRPTTTTSAQSAEAAGFGSSQYGEFGPPVTARDPRQTGPF
jgi:hypothetical protein